MSVWRAVCVIVGCLNLGAVVAVIFHLVEPNLYAVAIAAYTGAGVAWFGCAGR